MYYLLFQQSVFFCGVQIFLFVVIAKTIYYNFINKSSVGIIFGLNSKLKENIIMEEKKENFFKKAFREMGENAKAQHEVDRANFVATKAEAKATFEENRGTNSLKKANAIAKQSWDDAHMSPAERTAKTREEQKKQIEEANERIKVANERYATAKVEKKKK